MNRVSIYRVQLTKEKSFLVDDSAIRSPMDGAIVMRRYLQYMFGDAMPDREMCIAMWLNTKNCVTGVEVVSVGSLNASLVHPREVFKGAILHNAASVILAHNHPSGDITPSSHDIEISKRLKEAGEIIGIDFLDHIILGDEGAYYSLKENGRF